MFRCIVKVTLGRTAHAKQGRAGFRPLCRRPRLSVMVLLGLLGGLLWASANLLLRVVRRLLEGTAKFLLRKLGQLLLGFGGFAVRKLCQLAFFAVWSLFVLAAFADILR
ncbi:MULTISPECIES: hypothetical protein [Achromobacter]|uniref:Uncharacterized protein n=1 Tax=Achromobacter mucicolens TaxID=1389922 RepID=A0ABM8LKD5_9BURK|nr:MULTISPECIES: hypothetical protein [Achromobacter]AVG43934.1 hypothetical protein MC81_30995 [Achromobacter insolitus]CAB3845244.1 hypothetical protein LMG3410_01478 [Achromobacter aegrifaciens]CAB3914767.1 hypothetical protein LMG3415_05171 [Achromobacter mucicolens]